jgi:hypothetical protein
MLSSSPLLGTPQPFTPFAPDDSSSQVIDYIQEAVRTRSPLATPR